MQSVCSGHRPKAKLALLSAIASILAPSIAAASATPTGPTPNTEAPSITQIRTDLCRQVFRERLDGLVVHQTPSPYSPAVGGLVVNQQVTLAPGFVNLVGPTGQNWIEIVGPVKGYISNGFPGGPSNLVYCSVPSPEVDAVPEWGTLPDRRPGTVVIEEVPVVEALCRRVIQPEGLAIRQRPNPLAPRVGGVGLNERVQLESLVKIQGPSGRTWMPIVYPVAGYVSNGYENGRGNLDVCLR